MAKGQAHVPADGHGPDQDLLIEVSRSTDGTVLGVSGDLDHVSAPLLARAIERAIESYDGDAGRIVLDLHGVDFLDSAGVAVLATAALKLRGQGGLGLLNVTRQVGRVLTISGIGSVLDWDGAGAD